MKEQGLDGTVFDFWYLVGDDLGQHLRELHAQRLVDKGVEADLQQTFHHLAPPTERRGEERRGEERRGEERRGEERYLGDSFLDVNVAWVARPCVTGTGWK